MSYIYYFNNEQNTIKQIKTPQNPPSIKTTKYLKRSNLPPLPLNQNTSIPTTKHQNPTKKVPLLPPEFKPVKFNSPHAPTLCNPNKTPYPPTPKTNQIKNTKWRGFFEFWVYFCFGRKSPLLNPVPEPTVRAFLDLKGGRGGAVQKDFVCGENPLFLKRIRR